MFRYATKNLSGKIKMYSVNKSMLDVMSRCFLFFFFLFFLIKQVHISDDVFHDAVHVQRLCAHKYRNRILRTGHRSSVRVLCVFLGCWRSD